MSKFFTFEGRTNRLNYFMYTIAANVISAVSAIVCEHSDSKLLLAAILIFEIAVSAKLICLAVQRFHDIGRPGTHYWLLLIPLYNIYLGLVLLLKKGTEGDSIYGSDPLEQLS